MFKLSPRVPVLKVAWLALTKPFMFYLDVILDMVILQTVIVALGGISIIVENITSFTSTVSDILKQCYISIEN